MALTLHVDAERWRRRLRDQLAAAAERGVTVVPVTKGNGYGFGNDVLAAESATLGAAALAVGTYAEVSAVVDEFPADVLVLSPWRPWHAEQTSAANLVHTVSRLEDLHRIADGASEASRPRVVVEIATSMRRHGVRVDELPDVAKLLDGVTFEGFALHLPLAGDRLPEARLLAERAFDAAPHLDRRRLWVSHVSAAEAGLLSEQVGAEVRLRTATALWLGDRAALRPQATVLDVHPVRRGDTYGYRQRRARQAGAILIVAGGTAHGIALEAPTPAASIRQRAVALAKGGLEAAGKALSPFRVGGKQRWFAEPPHMQCSMIWLPADVKPPAPGDEVDVDVRFTTTTFDSIVWE